MKKSILLIFVALLAFTWSCQKEAVENFSQNDEIVLKSDPVGELVVDVTPGPGGNVECDQIAEQFDIDIVDSSDRIGYDNNATDPWYTGDGDDRIYYPDYPFPGLTVTVTDGTYVSWSYNPEPYQDEDGWWINLVGAVIVKGGPNANVYLYNTEEDGDWVYSDSGLSAPLNQNNNIPYGLSNLTFCFIRIPYSPPTCYEWQTETAWAANGEEPGELRYTNRGNWATYLTFEGVEKTVSLFAGQTTFVGEVKLTPVVVDEIDMVTINITLDYGWELAIEDYDEFGEPVEGVYREETVKIQGYNVRPSGNPAPGLFETYKGNELVITVPAYDFYGIHLDVGLLTQIECPEEEEEL